MDENQSVPTPAAPKISALVLSYNDINGLRRCLDALEKSTARPQMEILVVDNGSVDGSATADAEFPDVTFLRLPRNFGATKALNIAMRTAAADYFLYLSTEIEVASDAVAKLAAQLDQDADAVTVCPLVEDAQGHPAGDLWKLPNPDTLKRIWRNPEALQRVQPPEGEVVLVEYAGRSALMARKFFVKGLNYFDERFGDFGADLDLAYQIRRAGKKTLLVRGALATRHAAPALPSAAKTIVTADRANGVAVFLTKHSGAVAGIAFRVSAVLGALARLQLGPLIALAGSSKIDGSQSAF